MANVRIQQYPQKNTLGSTDLILVADASDINVDGWYKYKKVEAQTLATAINRAISLTRTEALAYINASALIQGGGYVITNAAGNTLSLILEAVSTTTFGEYAYNTANGERYKYNITTDTAILEPNPIALGTANQLLGVNAGATAQEYKTMDFVQPEWFGAVGDGVTDDTQGFKDAIASGINNLKLTSGKTYIISRQLTIPSNFTIDGNFATIKRADITLTTLASIASVGNTTLTVADASAFEIGDEIVLTDSTGANGGVRYTQLSLWSSGKTTITNIVGNVLTLNNAVVATQGGVTSFAVGSNVFKVNNLIITDSSNENILIKNVIFDGNSASNDKNFYWPLQSSINAVGVNITVQGCRFINSPNENVFLGGNSVIENCTYENLNGSFVHIGTSFVSGRNGVRIINNYGKNSNIKSSSLETGHSEGTITLSSGPRDIMIDGNIFDTSGGYVVAPIFPYTTDTEGSNRIAIKNNRCKSHNGIVYGACGSIGGAAMEEIVVENNIFNSCNSIYLINTNTESSYKKKTSGVYWSSISGNLIYNGQIVVECSANTRISENTINIDAAYTPSSEDRFKRSAINVTGWNIVVSRNTINCESGAAHLFGISFGGVGLINSAAATPTNYVYGANISIIGNNIANCTSGISATQSTHASTLSGSASGLNWLISNNNIQMPNYAASAFGTVSGVYATPGCAVRNNNIYAQGSSNGTCIYCIGVTSALASVITGPIIEGNIIRGNPLRSITYCINQTNNGHGTIIINNIVPIAVFNASGNVNPTNVEANNTELPVGNVVITPQVLWSDQTRY